MAIPDFLDYGPEKDAGVGSSDAQRTPNLPGSRSNGLTMVLYVASDGAPATLQTANGWQLAEADGIQASAGISGQCGMAIYWKRVTGSDSAPILNDPAVDGNTALCFHINIYSSVRTSGNPFHKVAVATVTSPTATIACPAVTTTSADCMIGGAAASSNDDQTFNSWGGTGVTSPSLDSGWHTSIGNDCAWAGGRSGKATAGTGNCSSTFGAATQQAQISFALASLSESGGSVAATLSDVASSATGSVEVQGSLGTQLDSLTLEAQENPQPVSGDLSATLGALETSASGTIPVQGALATSLADVSLLASQGPALALGNATVSQRVNAAQPTSGTWTTSAINTNTGATFLVSIARGVWAGAAAPEGPTDSPGNSYTRIGAVHAYAIYPDSRTGAYYASAGTGNASHTFSMTFGNGGGGGGGDEVTIMALAMEGVLALQAHSHVEQSAAAGVTGVAVTGTGPAIYISMVWGNGPVGINHNFQPSAGWTRVEAASATTDLHPNGYIQISVAAVVDTTGTLAGVPQNCTWSNPDVNEGGQIYQFVFQPTTGQLGALGISFANATVQSDGVVIPANVDGTLTSTLGSLVSAAVALVEVQGVTASVLTDVGSAASGVVEIQGVAAAVLDDTGLAAVGAVENLGQTSATLEDVGSVATGAIDVAGSSSSALDDLSLEATGSVPILGTAAASLADLVVVSDGQLPVVGNTSVFLEDITFSAAGAVDVRGAGAGQLGNVLLEAAGGVTLVGETSSTLDGLNLTAAGVVAVEGTLSVPLEDLSGVGTGQVPVLGGVAVELGAGGIEAAGVVDIQGVASIQLEDLQLVTSSAAALFAAASIVLSDLSVAASVLVEIQGATATTLQDLGSVAAGVVEARGVSFQSLENCLLEASGQLEIRGATAGLLAAIVADALGTIEIQASLSAVLDDCSLISGDLPTVVAGIVNTTLGNLALAVNVHVRHRSGKDDLEAFQYGIDEVHPKPPGPPATGRYEYLLLPASSPHRFVVESFLTYIGLADRKDLIDQTRVYRVLLRYLWRFPNDVGGCFVPVSGGTLRFVTDDPTLDLFVVRDWTPLGP